MTLEAQQAVVGGILMDNSRWLDASEFITSNDILDARLRMIYEACEIRAMERKTFDAVSIADECPDIDLALTATLVQQTPSSKHVRDYAKIVADHALNHRLSQAGSEITELCTERKPITEKIGEAQTMVLALTAKEKSRPESLPSLYRKVLMDIDGRKNNPEGRGLLTGLLDIDSNIHPFKPGRVVVLAARPSMGKSALAINIASHIGKEKSVLFFSLEMPKDEIVERVLSSSIGIDYGLIQGDGLPDEDWGRISQGDHALKHSSLYIDDQAGSTLNQLMAKARKHKHKHGLDLIVIDYVQLMQGVGSNRTEEIGSISRGLKEMAKDLECPVLLLSQLNRGVESRPNKRPMMSDLRQSGDIEQDADCILFLYRHEVYHEGSRPNVAELIVSKNRQGKTGTYGLTWQGQYQRFMNYSGNYNDIGLSEKTGDWKL